MRNTAIAVLALAGFAAPLGAQTQYNARAAEALKPHGRYEAPMCPLKGGDFRTSSAGLSLKLAAEGFSDEKSQGKSQIDAKKYTDLVRKAQGIALEALAANPKSAAGWYYLGRSDLQLGDLKGADSAFTKLEALSPECAEEVKSMRQKAWVPLETSGSDFLKSSQADSTPAGKAAKLDSSLALLRDAHLIARYYPLGVLQPCRHVLQSEAV